MKNFTEREKFIYMAGVAFGITCGTGNKTAQDRKDAQELHEICLHAFNHLCGLPADTNKVLEVFEQIKRNIL